LLRRQSGRWRAAAQNENAVSPLLSTKLSTVNVDKNKKPSVFRDLRHYVRIYMRFMLRRMIFSCRWVGAGNWRAADVRGSVGIGSIDEQMK
jgi:hypothetical protein